MKVYKAEQRVGNGKTIGVRKIVQSTPMPLHSHEFIELVYVLSGSALQQVDDSVYEVSHGDIIFINYNSQHAFEPKGEFCYVNLYFLPDVLASSVITRENASALLSLTAFDEMRKDQNGGKITFRGEDRLETDFINASILSCDALRMVSDTAA